MNNTENVSGKTTEKLDDKVPEKVEPVRATVEKAPKKAALNFMKVT